MAFVDMFSELAVTIPQISPIYCKTLINRAYREIRGMRSWSFLITPELVNFPTMVDTGTVTVATGSAVVTLDAAAATALQALVTSGFALPGLQFRVQNAGPVYTILTYDGAFTITLNQPIQIQNGAGQSYAVYQSLVNPPVTDFIRWIDVYDPNNGYAMTKIDVKQQEINRIDPTRSNQGQAYWISPVGQLTVASQMLYEFWPSPVQGQQFQCLVQRSGVDLVRDADTLPDVLDESLVLDRATYRAYKWAAANAGRLPELKGVNWGFLINDFEKKDVWARDYARVAKKDNERRENMLVYVRSRLVPWPIDSAFWQSHDVGYMNWGRYI